MLDYGTTSVEDQATYAAAFTAAENFWESNLTGYRDPFFFSPSEVTISVELAFIDGVFNVLGSAGPTNVFSGGSFLEVSAGQMTFDTADLDFLVDEGLLERVIRHEMGHVLGHGTLWSSSAVGFSGFQEVYVNGSGQYTGAAALTAYQKEFGQSDATFIPVELDGDTGTANGHWNEVTDNSISENIAGFDSDPGDGGPAPTVVGGINAGESLDDELMSGVATGSMFLSNTTLASFYDIGYTIADLNVIPEPAASAALISLFALSMVIRRRR